jgi:hypothetical protein
MSGSPENIKKHRKTNKKNDQSLKLIIMHTHQYDASPFFEFFLCGFPQESVYLVHDLLDGDPVAAFVEYDIL